ncbi:MAG TPA: SGNH/GDSL hydrolase family protein [Gemmatimonadaceae bacterium]|nr:SGNH/GDSL hydrolase family protein [Gemmatimonadaceae bacterium]
MLINSRLRRTALALAIATIASSCGRFHSSGDAGTDWTGAWTAAPQLTEPNNMPPAPPNTPPVPGLSGTTLRQVIHPSLGGTRWRFRVSNEFGDGPLVIQTAHVARSPVRGMIDPTTDAALLFSRKTSVTVPRGRAAVSDPVSFAADAFSDIAITLYVPQAPNALTGHPGSRTTSFITSGNQVSEVGFPIFTEVLHWYLISGAEVMSNAAGAVVILGNSIADGRGSTNDMNDRWPDDLAHRLAEARSANGRPAVAVLNAGIGGNAVVRGGLGPTALARFDRDVLAQARARWVIVCDGVNDIGGSRPDSAAAVALHLIDAYGEMIRRAHARGIKVFGGTIMPFGGSQYSSREHEAARLAVNAWIRKAGAFDAVIDFDAATRDPGDPSRLRGDVDGGDHLHPSAAGYRIMAAAVDLSLFAAPRD